MIAIVRCFSDNRVALACDIRLDLCNFIHPFSERDRSPHAANIEFIARSRTQNNAIEHL